MSRAFSQSALLQVKPNPRTAQTTPAGGPSQAAEPGGAGARGQATRTPQGKDSGPAVPAGSLRAANDGAHGPRPEHPGSPGAARELLQGAAAAVKGLRADLRGAAARPWIPKPEGPREEAAEAAAAGHEIHEFQEAGCRPRGGGAGGRSGGGPEWVWAGRWGLVWKVPPDRLRTPRGLGAHPPPPHHLWAGLPLGNPPPQVLTAAVLFQVKPIYCGWKERAIL